MGKTYQYLVSVIISVTSSSKKLISCLESIYNQSLGKENIQIILAEDVFLDNGTDIIREYKTYHQDINIVHINKEKANDSELRNFALSYAEGQFILFMNPGDMLNEFALYNIVRFFETCDDEVNLVLPYTGYLTSSGEMMPEADIYKKYLLNTGVYNADDIPIYFDDIIPCVRNLDIIHWDESAIIHEDYIFFFHVISRSRNRFGYMKEAKYLKNVDADAGKNYLRTFKKVSVAILYAAEEIENMYPIRVVYGAQSSILGMLHDHVMHDDSFWPHQYDEQRFHEFEESVKKLLYYIDTRTILSMDFFDKYEKSYWVNLKPDKCVDITIEENKIKVFVDSLMLEDRKDVEWTLRRILVQKDYVTIYGDFKLALFDFLSEKDKLNFEICLNSSHYETLDVKPSFAGYPQGSRIKMNHHWAFSYKFSVIEIQKAEFRVVINGVKLNTRIVNCYNTVFGKKLGLTEATVGKVLITQEKSKILNFKYLEEQEVIRHRNKLTERFLNNKYVFELRKECNEYLDRRIWLYNDNFAMIDNAYILFCHDLKKEDGIEKYYIIKDKTAQIYVDAEENVREHFLIYGSREHILFFLNAEKIFTAFTSGLEWRALQHNEMYQYWDIFRAEVVLLSHGMLNQYWPWSFSPIRMPVDKVVVSAQKEAEAWELNGFWRKDFIMSGMPRYEELKQNADVIPQRRIIVALSWRMYLAGKHEILLDAATPRIALDERYTNSSYFLNFMKFLNSRKLQEALEQYDVDLDVKLHPQFDLIYRNHIHLQSTRVHLTTGEVNLADYMAMVSDISSIIFDFVFFKRPVQYFIPDILEFKSGCNHFREVVIPFEDGLGPYAFTPEDAVDNLCRLMENNFEMDPVYQERIVDFHIPLDAPCEKIYQYCLNE